MKQSEFKRHVGAENICASINDALQRAEKLYHEQYAHPESALDEVNPSVVR